MMQLIATEVAKSYRVHIDYMMQNCRDRDIVEPRQVAMTITKYLSDGEKLDVKYSLAKIGLYFGNKDHATVSHAKKTINNLCDSDKKFKNRYNRLINIIMDKLYTDKMKEYRLNCFENRFKRGKLYNKKRKIIAK